MSAISSVNGITVACPRNSSSCEKSSFANFSNPENSIFVMMEMLNEDFRICSIFYTSVAGMASAK